MFRQRQRATLLPLVIADAPRRRDATCRHTLRDMKAPYYLPRDVAMMLPARSIRWRIRFSAYRYHAPAEIRCQHAAAASRLRRRFL